MDFLNTGDDHGIIVHLYPSEALYLAAACHEMIGNYIGADGSLSDTMFTSFANAFELAAYADDLHDGAFADGARPTLAQYRRLASTRKYFTHWTVRRAETAAAPDEQPQPAQADDGSSPNLADCRTPEAAAHRNALLAAFAALDDDNAALVLDAIQVNWQARR